MESNAPRLSCPRQILVPLPFRHQFPSFHLECLTATPAVNHFARERVSDTPTFSSTSPCSFCSSCLGTRVEGGLYFICAFFLQWRRCTLRAREVPLARMVPHRLHEDIVMCGLGLNAIDSLVSGQMTILSLSERS